MESELRIDEALAAGLEGLEGFSHILVVFWMDRIPEHMRTVEPARPGNRADLPAVGPFASRTQLRPNPIGVAAVRLLSRRGAVLRVRALDALNGSPVLDIKPYLPPYDAVSGATMPRWVYG